MREARLGTRDRSAGGGKRQEAGLERQAAESQQHPRLGDQLRFGDQVLPAVRELLGKRPVVGRRALDRRRQQCSVELEAIARPNRLRAVGKPDRMDRAEEKVP